MCFWYQCPELPDPSRDVLEPLAIPNKREIKILNDISYVECYDKSSIIVVWNCQLHDIFIRVLRIANDFFHRMGELWKRKRGKGIFFCVLRCDISSLSLKSWKYVEFQFQARNDLVASAKYYYRWSNAFFFLPKLLYRSEKNWNVCELYMHIITIIIT